MVIVNHDLHQQDSQIDYVRKC